MTDTTESDIGESGPPAIVGPATIDPLLAPFIDALPPLSAEA